jgi:hypothetical protein
MNMKVTAIVTLFTVSILTVAAYPAWRGHPVIDPLLPTLPPQGHAAVEAVFVLDTTGSMGGMIDTAKETIWSIASTFAQGDPTPEISIGLVAFRDRGDEYVTRVTDLTTDLDALYAELMQLEAAGGGDVPEAVNDALYDAVHRISWSSNPNSYKVIFLVGDAPPHMNYPDDVKYPQTLAVAGAQGIVVNTIQCGSRPATAHHWQRIATLGQGRYFTVEQAGGGIAINTPFDEQLAQASRELSRTGIYVGSDAARAAQQARLQRIDELTVTGTRIAQAARAEYYSHSPEMIVGASGAGAAGADELVMATRDGRVDIADIEEDALPESLRALSVDERRALVEETAERRAELEQQIRELSAQRQAFIAEQLSAAGNAESSLNYQIFDTVRAQAGERGITYEGGPVY